jgi:DUF1680 family protein
MYAAMADIAALTDAEGYKLALEAIWQNMVSRKMYLTGGIGSRHQGEAFGENYELPNQTAYNETCAAIASVMWNHRMFLLTGKSKYIDVLERTLYNGLLAGISLEGNAFFYPNPLMSDGEHAFNLEGQATRSPWFSCSCCPTNVVRFFPSLPGYVYAQRDDEVFVNLYIAGQVALELPKGRLTLEQRTQYPWDGTVEITVHVDTPTTFTLALRLPNWARGEVVPSDLYQYVDANHETIQLLVDGEPVTVPNEGYVRLTRTWHGGERVRLVLPMNPRLVRSHANVTENTGRVALERGPLVYCAEAADNQAVLAANFRLDGDFRTEHRSDLLGGVTLVHHNDWTLIPYYAWSHRGVGEMQVWLQSSES